MKKIIIWSDRNLNIDDWRDDLKSTYEDFSDDELYDIMHKINSDYLQDERQNLNIDIGREIICIANLGLWYGRKSAYKMIGTNIAQCLYSECDSTEWFVNENNDLQCIADHHDGTNYYTYRAFKVNVTEKQKYKLLVKIYNNVDFSEELKRYTMSIGKYIRKVYGA